MVTNRNPAGLVAADADIWAGLPPPAVS